jgi:uncharacterized protein YkwD
MATAAPARGAAAEGAYAAQMTALVNDYRKTHGLRPLAADPRLATLAQAHSAAMAAAARMSHDDFPARAKASGRPLCVENVGWNYGSAAAQFAAWRASPGHDHNMRDARVDAIGVGIDHEYVTLIACGN